MRYGQLSTDGSPNWTWRTESMIARRLLRSAVAIFVIGSCAAFCLILWVFLNVTLTVSTFASALVGFLLLGVTIFVATSEVRWAFRRISPAPLGRAQRALCVFAGVIAVAAIVSLLVPAPTIWRGPVTADSTNGGGLQSVSCSSVTSCDSFDWDGRLFVFNGTSWARAVGVNLVHALSEPLDISCAAAHFCVIVDDFGHVIQVDGNRESITSLTSGHSLSAVSCPTTQFCVAVGGSDVYVMKTGRWRAQVVENPETGRTLDAVACTSATFCVASGSGDAAVFNGRRWSLGMLPLAVGDELGQLSCRSPNFCVGISLAGQWLTFGGKAWRNMGPFGGGAQNEGYTPNMLACPVNGRCILSTTKGVLYELRAGHWSRLGYLFRESWARRILETVAPTPAVSVACPSATECVAVDGGGLAYVGRL